MTLKTEPAIWSRVTGQRISCYDSCQSEEVGHAPNCIMVEAINQSGARIFLRVNLEEIVARGMKKIFVRVFSALTSLVI